MDNCHHCDETLYPDDETFEHQGSMYHFEYAEELALEDSDS